MCLRSHLSDRGCAVYPAAESGELGVTVSAITDPVRRNGDVVDEGSRWAAPKQLDLLAALRRCRIECAGDVSLIEVARRRSTLSKKDFMTELMRMQTSGGFILVEVDDTEPGFERVSRDGSIIKAKETFEKALEDVKVAAQSALQVMTSGPHSPEGVEVEFGVRLNAEAGAVVAKASLEGHLKVTLSWRRPQNI